MIEPIDRFLGCLFGLATGDALGAPVEFQAPGTFDPITEMRSGRRVWPSARAMDR